MTQKDTAAALNWRYATKAFDSSKKLTVNQLQALKDALRLSASSFGLQPWTFIHVTSANFRAELVQHAWGQKQVADASDLFVICRPESYTVAHVDAHIDRMAELKGVGVETFAGFRKMVVGHVENMSAERLEAWTSRQLYIALGSLLTVAAYEGIDAVPMEGFVPAEVDRVLGLEKLGLKSVLLCPVGFRAADDKYAVAPKIRFSEEQVFVEL